MTYFLRHSVLLLAGLVGFLTGPVAQIQAQKVKKGQGPGRRPQPLALSPKQELALGRKAYRELLEQAKGRVLPADSAEAKRVRQVMDRITKAAAIEPLQREMNLRVKGYRFEWEIHIIRDRQVNAFCLPGGKVAVYTGLLRVARRDDQLAAVLAHEIAHALAHHASERVAREKGGWEGFFRRKAYDRGQEAEADHIGVFLMTFAGYDPKQAVRFWDKMGQARGRGRLPEILSDHPSDAHRIRMLRRWVPYALAAKRAYGKGDIAPPRNWRKDR
jgi:predicted Zn-dependent protease